MCTVEARTVQYSTIPGTGRTVAYGTALNMRDAFSCSPIRGI